MPAILSRADSEEIRVKSYRDTLMEKFPDRINYPSRKQQKKQNGMLSWLMNSLRLPEDGLKSDRLCLFYVF